MEKHETRFISRIMESGYREEEKTHGAQEHRRMPDDELVVTKNEYGALENYFPNLQAILPLSKFTNILRSPSEDPRGFSQNHFPNELGDLHNGLDHKALQSFLMQLASGGTNQLHSSSVDFIEKEKAKYFNHNGSESIKIPQPIPHIKTIFDQNYSQTGEKTPKVGFVSTRKKKEKIVEEREKQRTPQFYSETSNSAHQKPHSSEEEGQETASSKLNLKNTYVHKINSLIKTAEEPKVHPRKEKKIELSQLQTFKEIHDDSNLLLKTNVGGRPVGSTNLKKVKSNDRLNEKLKRNRESARNSRKRKKIYIELLETKVRQLTDELDEAKKLISNPNSSQAGASKLGVKGSWFSNEMSAGRQILFERLEKMLEEGSDENELNLLIDSLRLRLGATGKERVNALDNYFKQIYDTLIPAYMRYLLWISASDLEFKYGPNTKNPQNEDLTIIFKDFEAKELIQDMTFTENQKKNLLKYKKKLAHENNKLKGLVQKLNEMRRTLHRQTYTLENMVDELRNVFSPKQIAKFLIFIESRKQKEFTAEKLWLDFEEDDNSLYSKSESEDMEDSIADNNNGMEFMDMLKETMHLFNGKKEGHITGEKPSKKQHIE